MSLCIKSFAFVKILFQSITMFLETLTQVNTNKWVRIKKKNCNWISYIYAQVELNISWAFYNNWPTILNLVLENTLCIFENSANVQIGNIKINIKKLFINQMFLFESTIYQTDVWYNKIPHFTQQLNLNLILNKKLWLIKHQPK